VVKQNVTLAIDKEIYEKAHALGINVSKACENYLKQLIEAIEGINRQDMPKNRIESLGRDLDPRPLPYQGNFNSVEDWQTFRLWIQQQGYSKAYATNLFNYAQQYFDCLVNRDLSKVCALKESVRPNVLKALSALSKFLGCYEDYKVLLRNHGLGWIGRSTDDIIIDRLTRSENSCDIWVWVKQVKEARHELNLFMDLLAVSGLRFAECVEAYNLIVKLHAENNLTNYYNYDKCVLEHYKFKDVFLRNTKKAFISFVPSDLIDVIRYSPSLPNGEYIKKLVQGRRLPLRFGDVREAHGTLMTKYLNREEIDFLQGRVSSSVFMQHYFNPALITDLKERVFKGIDEILRLTNVLEGTNFLEEN